MLKNKLGDFAMGNKILFVRTVPQDFNPNGYNVQGFGLGKAFCKMGYDFDFISFTKGKEESSVYYEYNGHKLNFIKKKRFRWFRTGINLNILKEDLDKYDFIITNEYGQYMTYAFSQSKFSDKVVMYSGPYYNLFKIPFASPFYDVLFSKKINKGLKHKFVKSELAKEFLENKGFTDLKVLGVGLDIERFDADIEITSEVKELMSYMNSNKCLLYVGALSDRKNFPFLLDVYSKIRKQNSDVKLVIIGKGKKTYVNKYMNKLSHDDRENIFMLEKVDNSQLKYIYPLARAFLLPSKLEIYGMVLLEAMYLGAPVVTSWNGGSSVLINGKNTGQIVKKFDVKQWAVATQKYLDDSEFAKEVADNAKSLIEKEFVWDVLAKKILEEVKSTIL